MTIVRGFLGWWAGTKPMDIITGLVSLLSIGIALVAFVKADEASNQQAEAAAPVLAPGTPPSERGKHILVTTEYAEVRKRADRLFLDRSTGRLVIPIRNGGIGIAMAIGLPVIVADCREEPAILPDTTVLPPLGTYVVPSGNADQLAYIEPKGRAGGAVPGRPKLWFSFDYRRFGKITPAVSDRASLLLWYTDGAQRKLRWTCVSYLPAGHNSRGQTEWGVYDQYFGTRQMVPVEANTQ